MQKIKLKQKAREMFEKVIIDEIIKDENNLECNVEYYKKHYLNQLDQIIDMAIAERDKEIVKAVKAERERILNLAEDVEVEKSFGYDSVTLKMIDVRNI